MAHTHQHSAHDHSDHQHTAHGHGAHDHFSDGYVEVCDLDAEVLGDHLADITARLPVTSPPRLIVDLGCGTGAGTFALLDRFPDAAVTAVDTSETHLHRLGEKAAERGLTDRVRIVRADLDEDWPDLGVPDLVWASASMHHMADPDRALRNVYEILTPGGLFAMLELSSFPRFLPADAPEDRPGLEERCHHVNDDHHTEHVPHLHADWPPKLKAAGFTIEHEQTISVHIPNSENPKVADFALAGLRRIRENVTDSLTPEDRAALDRLLDTTGPHSILNRPDLAVRTERAIWAARRGA